MSEKRKDRGRRVTIVASVVCVLAVVVIGIELWHPWGGGTATPGGGGVIGKEAPLGEDVSSGDEDEASVYDGMQTLYEVLPPFTIENPAAGPGAILPSQVSGFSVYWRQCPPDDPECSFREQRPDGTVACYKLRSGYEYKQPGRSGAESYGLTEVSADDPWQKAYLDASSCEVHYYVLRDDLQGTAKGDEQLRNVAPAGVDIYSLMTLDPNLYDDFPLKIDGTDYEAGSLRVRFAQDVDINEAVDVVYSEGCWWSHYPELIRWEDEFASLSDEYRPDPSTLGPDNYVAVRLPAGSSLDEYRERFLSHPQVEECRLVGYSRGSVDTLEDIRPLESGAEVA